MHGTESRIELMVNRAGSLSRPADILRRPANLEAASLACTAEPFVVKRPSVLIVAAKWWPLSARLASALAHQGCDVSAIGPRGHPLWHLSGLRRMHSYSGLASLASLERAIETETPDFIVPCDDGAVAQIHALYATKPSLRDVISRSLGDPRSFDIVRSRYRLLATAQELGLATPQTRRVHTEEDLSNWYVKVAAAGVVKVDGESGGNGVRFCASLEEALAARRELTEPPSLTKAWKRWAVDRDPLALWRLQQRAAPEVTIQRIIDGRPANCMAFCRDGQVISVVSVIVLAAEGPTGASTIISRWHDTRMTQAAERLAKALDLSGFFGLDFMIETGSGIPYLIEMNPRCTQLGHLEFADQNSLAAVFASHWRGEPVPRPSNPLPGDDVALFPQALRTPAGRHLDTSYLDVPRDEPRLAAELRLPPWPYRRWTARLYHSVRSAHTSACIEYERMRSTPEPLR